MVLCPLQVDSSASGDSVTDLPFRHLGLNQQTYERLKAALNLGLRRQVFIAVCDDLLLRDRLAVQLQADLTHSETVPRGLSGGPIAESRVIPRLVTLELELHDPNPVAQVIDWLSYFPGAAKRNRVPTFQILGVERLTRQSAGLQSLFLSYLQEIEQSLPEIESGLLLWMTQPWFRMLPEAVPEFWRCRTGVFEFSGDPTPLPATSPERIPVGPSSRDQAMAPTVPVVENPWIALADSLTLWYESDAESDPEPDDRTDTDPKLAVESFESLETDLRSLPDLGEWIGTLNPAELRESTAAASAPTEEQSRQSPTLTTTLTTAPSAVPNTDLNTALPFTDLPLDLVRSLTEFTDLSDLGELLSEVLIQDSTQNSADGPTAEQVEYLAGDLTGDLINSSGQTPPDQTNIAAAEAVEPLWTHIELLQQQLALLQTGQESPLAMATAYRTLGNFYRDCIEQGDASTENLTLAVQAYEQARPWLPPDQQAEVLNDLGNLYWMIAHTQTGPEEIQTGLLQTVQVYQLALEHLEPQSQTNSQPAQTYAMVQNNLGAVYADIAHYQDPAHWLQRSVVAYQEALVYRPAEHDPLRYASTQNNLGTTYWNLAQHQQPELNLKQAIVAYSEAQRYSDPAQEPIYYAMIQNNLGTAYWNLAQYEPLPDYLLAALAAYRAALQYRTPEAAPAGFAATQNNLGTAYWHLANQTQTAERLTYLNEAVAAYELTLEAAESLRLHHPQTALNFDLASTYNNLGLAHYQIALDPSVPTAAVARHLELALQHHLSALQSWHQSELRQTALHCLVQTLRACYSQLGLSGQNQALAQIPSDLLAEILPRL
jgi:hypothetical protein